MVKVTLFKGLRAVALVALLGIGFQAYTSVSQPPTGRTGAPGQSNCTSCHNGTINSVPGSVTLTGLPPTGYVPGTTYPLTVTVTDASASRFGFELTVLGATNTSASFGTVTLTNTTNTTRQSFRGIIYVGHRNANSNHTWSFDWTAPAAGTGTLKVYMAGIGGNGNNRDTGDHTFTTQVTVPEDAGVTGLADAAALEAGQLTVLPNPSQHRLALAGSAVDGAQGFQLLDALGRTVLQRDGFATECDVQGLPDGQYVVQLQTAQGQWLKRRVVIQH